MGHDRQCRSEKRPDSLSPSCNANPANGVMSACTDNIFSQEMAKILPVHRQLKILANTAHLHMLIENSLAQIF